MEDGFLLVSSFPALGATAESAGVDPMSASHPGSHVTSKRSLLTLLWPLFRPYRWLIAVALALNAVHGVAISFQTIMTKYLIDDVVLKQGISSLARAKLLAILVATYLGVSLIGRMLFWHLGYRIFTRVREHVIFALRMKFFSHVNHLCLRFHRVHNSGELFNYLFGTPLAQIQQYFQQFTMHITGAMFSLIASVGWVALWDVPMTLVMTLSVVLTVVVLNYSRSTMRRLMTDYQKTESNVSGYVADLLRGTRDVKLYAIEDRVEEDFKDRVQMISRESVARDISMHVQWMKQETVGYLCFALLCVMGVWRYLEHQISIGELQGYLAAFVALQSPLQQLFTIGTMKGGAQASLDRIDTVLTTASTTPDPIGEVRPVPPLSLIHI